MTSDGGDQDKIANYVAECKKRGIKILPPDINLSTDEFIPAHDGIRYRITTIKHVGTSAINHIEELRPIISFDDMLERRQKKHLKTNVVTNLIKAGAFDSMNPDRSHLMWLFDMHNRTKTQIKNEEECDKYEYNDKLKAEWEMDVLGMYLSVHPMEKYSFKPLEEYEDESYCIQGGEVVECVVRQDKNGGDMAFITLSTLHGRIRVLVFTHLWAKPEIHCYVQEGELLLIRGKRSKDAVLLNSLEVLE